MNFFQKSFVFVAIVSLMTLTCCTNVGDAIISVKVEKSGSPVKDEMVYMYQGNFTDTIYAKNDAKPVSMEKTDASGIVEFTIKSLSVGDGGTYRIFETFNDNDSINGRVAAFISNGAKRMPLTLTQK